MIHFFFSKRLILIFALIANYFLSLSARYIPPTIPSVAVATDINNALKSISFYFLMVKQIT